MLVGRLVERHIGLTVILILNMPSSNWLIIKNALKECKTFLINLFNLFFLNKKSLDGLGAR